MNRQSGGISKIIEDRRILIDRPAADEYAECDPKRGGYDASYDRRRGDL